MNGAPERPSFRRILVGLDASRQSLQALETAALWAAEMSAELMGLFVEDAGLLDIAALPVSPRASHSAKKPSIFSLTPPIACTWPRWLTEPVTASDCPIGTSARADMSAYSSAEEALSPSIPP